MTAATKSRPLVSIIMPAFNAGKYVGAAIRSVLAQSYDRWELIIIDDASTDDTPAVVAGFTDPRIVHRRVARISHPAGVRNVGLRMARGDLVAFLDADDLYLPDAIETLAAFLLRTHRAVAVYGFCNWIDARGLPIGGRDLLVPRYGGGYSLPPTYSHDWRNLVLGEFSCLLPGLMLWRTALDRVGFFNEQLCGPEDYEFYIRLFLCDHDGVYCLPEYVYRYRNYAESLTKSMEQTKRIMASNLLILEWMFSHPAFPKSIQAFKSQAYTRHYSDLSRERLIQSQRKACREVAIAALGNPNVRLPDWGRRCLPLIARSYLPGYVDAHLIRARQALRYRYFRYLERPAAS